MTACSASRPCAWFPSNKAGMTAEFDVVGFFDELMCALGEIAGYVGVVDHGR